ncbi:unnamed protein product, partial [Coregonus sp. 'balchen']
MGKEQDLLVAVKSGDILLAHKLLTKVKCNKTMGSCQAQPQAQGQPIARQMERDHQSTEWNQGWRRAQG